MRTLLLTLSILLAPVLFAQEPPAPGTSPMHETPPPTTPQERLQAISGTLKDLHGQVHTHLGHIDRRLRSGVTDRDQEQLGRLREELNEAQARLEGALADVNNASPEELEPELEKAQTVVDRVVALLDRMKDTRTSAVN